MKIPKDVNQFFLLNLSLRLKKFIYISKSGIPHEIEQLKINPKQPNFPADVLNLNVWTQNKLSFKKKTIDFYTTFRYKVVHNRFFAL